MKNDGNKGVMIGKHIPWDEIKGHGFRVEHFLPLATVEQGKVRAFSIGMPYASLSVDCPAFRSKYAEMMLPVLHKLDFFHLWELYKERGVKRKEEVLVFYAPQESGWRRLFGKSFPHLRIEVRPSGSNEEIYNETRMMLRHFTVW